MVMHKGVKNPILSPPFRYEWTVKYTLLLISSYSESSLASYLQLRDSFVSEECHNIRVEIQPDKSILDK
jgi:hypothetical protein